MFESKLLANFDLEAKDNRWEIEKPKKSRVVCKHIGLQKRKKRRGVTSNDHHVVEIR